MDKTGNQKKRNPKRTALYAINRLIGNSFII